MHKQSELLPYEQLGLLILNDGVEVKDGKMLERLKTKMHVYFERFVIITMDEGKDGIAHFS